MLIAASPFLESNLRAHRARWNVGSSSHPEGAVSVEPGAHGWPRISLGTEDGRWLRVHSDRQPHEEASRWITQAANGAVTARLVCIVGAGYGYVLEELVRQTPPETRFLVLEPEPAFVPLLFARHDWTSLIEAGRLLVLAGPHYVGRAEAWRLVDAEAAEPLILRHGVIVAERPESAKEAAVVIGRALNGAKANEEARRRFAAPYLLNTLRNLPVVAQARDVRSLFGTGVGRPVIVAGAGPSLNRNLEELAAIDHWRDRATVIAVDTALKPMLAAGLQPHYVVGVDPGIGNARMLTDLPEDLETALVGEASLAPSCFTAFSGRTYLFKVSESHQPWPWLKGLGIDVARLRAWGSVLTTAFDFALELGGDPITFIGADLAYTNGQPYCRDTVYEADWALAVASGIPLETLWRRLLPTQQLLQVEADGRSIETSRTLVAFRDWLVAQTTGDERRRFVNATGDGILAGLGITRASLAEVLSDRPGARRHEPHPDPASQDGLQRQSTLTAAAMTMLREVLPTPSHQVKEWLDFTRGGATLPELTVALAETPAASGFGDEASSLLTARHRVVTEESQMWQVLRGRVTGGEWPPLPRQPCAPGDPSLGQTPSTVLPEGPISDFHSFRCLHNTQRRLEHLATLNLPLRGRRILEAGAGVGDLTDFFLDRDCSVHTTDVRPAHIAALTKRFALHPRVTVGALDLDPPPDTPPARFEIVFGYGLLCHLSDPVAALDYLSAACGDLLLLELIVTEDHGSSINPKAENPSLAVQAFTGQACRPNRTWLYDQLRQRFAHVYVPLTQPNHYEFPVDWSVPSPFARRAIFVASRQPLANPALTSTLPQRQSRH